MTDKVKNIIAWVMAALLTLGMLAAGASKLMGAEEVVANFEDKWGYNTTFMYIIGVLEVLGAIGLMIPKTRTLAGIGLVLLMLGATYTHIASDDMANIGGALMNLAFLAIFLYLRKSEIPFLSKE